MAPTVYFVMTIFLLFTIINAASIKSDVKNINIISEKCRELLTNGDRSNQRNYCIDTTDFYSDAIQKEIEERVGLKLYGITKSTQRNNSAPLANDNCASVDAQQNCCTKSGWETPTSVIINDETAIVVQTQKIVQQVKTVECAEKRKRCFDNLGFLRPANFATECQTNYAYQKVYVYFPNNKTSAWAYIKTPVSCSCVISIDSTQDYSIQHNSLENDYFVMDESLSNNIFRHI